MRYLIGTDEAGYGPNLGPLVMAATLWLVPDDVDGETLYSRLPHISASPDRLDRDQPGLCIGDSKTLYRAGEGLATLESGVLAAQRSARRSGVRPQSWRQVLVACDPACESVIGTIPWYRDFDRPVPVSATVAAVESAAAVLQSALESCGIELVAVGARLVFPQEFNERVRACGSKATALSLWTLELVRSLTQGVDDHDLLIQGDKHGGRSHYAALLQQVFGAGLVRVVVESRARSEYSWHDATRTWRIQFVARGERLLPAALSSMIAKYLRELSMLALNDFWQRQDATLRPTAGYPVDARRFRLQIAPLLDKLGIADDVLWRAR
jgi:hypothetical protein